MELLEVLPELTPRFELVIIDDGSTDATIEVADDLVAQYPQISVVYHAEPMGRSRAIQSGLARAVGDVIFLRDDDGCLALDEIQKLWREIDEHPLVLGRAKSARWPGRWVGWRRRDVEGGFRMVDRRAIRDVQASLEDQVRLVTGLSRAMQSWHEVPVAARAKHHPAKAPKGHGRGHTAQRPAPATPVGPAQKVDKPKRPNYLRSLKDFTVGE